MKTINIFKIGNSPNYACIYLYIFIYQNGSIKRKNTYNTYKKYTMNKYYACDYYYYCSNMRRNLVNKQRDSISNRNSATVQHYWMQHVLLCLLNIVNESTDIALHSHSHNGFYDMLLNCPIGKLYSSLNVHFIKRH